MELSYSDLVLNEVSQLDLVSKSSKLNVDSVNVLKIDSRRDKLYFKQVEYFYGKSNFTQVWVYDFLQGKRSLYEIRGTDHRACGARLQQDHMWNRNIPISPSILTATASLAFDILHHEKSMLRLPGSEVLCRRDSLDGKDHLQDRGHHGIRRAPVGQVNIDALQKCFINISYK